MLTKKMIQHRSDACPTSVVSSPAFGGVVEVCARGTKVACCARPEGDGPITAGVSGFAGSDASSTQRTTPSRAVVNAVPCASSVRPKRVVPRVRKATACAKSARADTSTCAPASQCVRAETSAWTSDGASQRPISNDTSDASNGRTVLQRKEASPKTCAPPTPRRAVLGARTCTRDSTVAPPFGARRVRVTSAGCAESGVPVMRRRTHTSPTTVHATRPTTTSCPNTS